MGSVPSDPASRRREFLRTRVLDTAAADHLGVVVGLLVVSGSGPHAALGTDEVAAIDVDGSERAVVERIADRVDGVVAHGEGVGHPQRAPTTLNESAVSTVEELVVFLTLVDADHR